MSHVHMIISHIETLLHFNIIMLYVDINYSHGNITMLHMLKNHEESPHFCIQGYIILIFILISIYPYKNRFVD